MAKTCSNCDRLGSVVDEQKSKLQLLEARLKDVLRAYKGLAKEKEDLMSINASITADVDSTQQKRIADLEESVVHMSTICGKFELERSQEKEQTLQLEMECDRLRRQLETSSQKVPDLPRDPAVLIKPKENRNKACQTEVLPENPPEIFQESNRPASEEKFTQTNLPEDGDLFALDQRAMPISKVKYETAIVTPLQRDATNSDDELEYLSNGDLEVTTHREMLPNESEVFTSADPDSSLGNNGTSLFYINELARRELELAEYKLRVREHECSLRELQWKYSNEKYRLQSRIADLEVLNSNFMTSKGDRTVPSNTINVAYIRNVLTKLMETKDKEQKQIMINALLTALNSI